MYYNFYDNCKKEIQFYSFMQIIEVNTNRLIHQFHQLPFFIYQNDTNFIAPIWQDVEKLFDPQKNKLFTQGGKAIRWLLVDDAGRCIGRIAAFIHPKTAYTQLQKTGGIGFFECINDQKLANFLFDTAKKWLIDQGMEAMDGPINFGERHQFWGLLTDNFTSPPSYGMNYNLPYYRQLFENYGFQIFFEQFVFSKNLATPLRPVFDKVYQRVMAQGNYSFSNAVGYTLERLALDFQTVYNNAWGQHPGFEPMTLSVATKTIQAFWPVMDPRVIAFAYDRNRPIAFYINIPELNEIFRYIDGNLNFWGKLKALYYLKVKKVSKTLVGIVFGVDQKYHGKGIDIAMIKWTEKNFPLTQYTTTILTWIADYNLPMLKVAEVLGSSKIRTLTTFRYLFKPNTLVEREKMPLH